MDENKDQAGESVAEGTGQYPPVELGPLEKLEEGDALVERTPGAQKPDSEVQAEINPNTE